MGPALLWEEGVPWRMVRLRHISKVTRTGASVKGVEERPKDLAVGRGKGSAWRGRVPVPWLE